MIFISNYPSVSECKMKPLVFVIIFLMCTLSTSLVLSCEIEDSLSGNIVNRRGTKCWTIIVPYGKFAHLKFNYITSTGCDNAYVQIKTEERNEKHKFCKTNNEIPFTSLSNITVTHFEGGFLFGRASANFSLNYQIKDIKCIHKDSFQCSNNSCISKSKICDGVVDCENGTDEVGCERGVFTVEGVNESRLNAISWLIKKRTATWGWGENTPRVVVALFLASGATFNGTVLEEELMAKETELKTAISLLKHSLSNSELSTFINALLVTCHNPRYFYGNNLVKRLKDKVEASTDITHPLAYLALCNANETWPIKAESDLIHYLNSSTTYPFVKDLQALSVLALSCRANSMNDSVESSAMELYNSTIQDLKDQQQQDGSMGNVYTTALITQALISSGQESSMDWNLTATIKYLMREINSSSVDLLSMHSILPILNGKTLADLSKVNCSANPRKEGNDLVSNIKDYNGPKIRVQYSLYIGNDKDIIHTISLRVPTNSTAFEVMQGAESNDPKFKFEWKPMAGEIYVYGIANIKNDPEIGNFWLLYSQPDTRKPLVHLTTSVDNLLMKDKDHLIYWYKTAKASNN